MRCVQVVDETVELPQSACSLYIFELPLSVNGTESQIVEITNVGQLDSGDVEFGNGHVLFESGVWIGPPLLVAMPLESSNECSSLIWRDAIVQAISPFLHEEESRVGLPSGLCKLVDGEQKVLLSFPVSTSNTSDSCLDQQVILGPALLAQVICVQIAFPTQSQPLKLVWDANALAHVGFVLGRGGAVAAHRSLDAETVHPFLLSHGPRSHSRWV